MTPKRKEEITKRIIKVKSSHPCNTIPEGGDLEMLDELLKYMNALEKYIDSKDHALWYWANISEFPNE